MWLFLLVGFSALLLMALVALWTVCEKKTARRDQRDSLRIVEMKRARGEIGESEYRRVKEILNG